MARLETARMLSSSCEGDIRTQQLSQLALVLLILSAPSVRRRQPTVARKSQAAWNPHPSPHLLVSWGHRLIDEERLKAEEAQRKAILNLNASGAVARLILQAQERRYDTRCLHEFAAVSRRRECRLGLVCLIAAFRIEPPGRCFFFFFFPPVLLFLVPVCYSSSSTHLHIAMCLGAHIYT